MNPALASRLRKAAALAILAALLAAFAVLAVAPVVAHLDGLKARIETERVLLGRLEAIAGRQGEARDIERQAKSSGDATLFIEGDSEPLRMARLQALVGDAAAAAGVRPRSTRALPLREQGALRLIGLRVQFSAPLDQVQRLMSALETGEPPLIVDGWQIVPAPATSAQASALVDARLDVYGAVAQKRSGAP